MRCECEQLPQIFNYARSPNNLKERLVEVDAKGENRLDLYRCRFCSQHWQIDVWDKYQTICAIKIDARESWQSFDDKPLRMQLLISNNTEHMKNFIKAILCFVLLSATQSAWGQNAAPELLRREVKIGTQTYGYRVYVPKMRNSKKKIPVMLFLHGNGVNGTDNERQIQGIDQIVYKNPNLFNFIIVFPQARPNTVWIGDMTAQALKALDQTVEEFNGNSKRLYLSGFSMGGYGTWTTAALYPNKFAALVPVAGGIVPPFQIPEFLKKTFPPEIVTILDAPDSYNALAKRIENTPVWLSHGSADEAVPVTESRKISEALKKNGNKNVFYTEYANTNHNGVLLKAFTEPKLYQWLDKQKK